MFRRYLHYTYRNEICVTIFYVNVYTNYICINFKYKNLPVKLYHSIPHIYQGNINIAIIIKEYTNIRKMSPHTGLRPTRRASDGCLLLALLIPEVNVAILKFEYIIIKTTTVDYTRSEIS